MIRSRRKLVLTVGALLALLTALLLPNAARGQALSTAFGLPTPRCNQGDTPVMPVAMRVTAHGADVYTYDEAGQSFDAYVPPKGFDPLTADNATLAEMNMPPRPASGDASSWTKDMIAYQGTALPQICESSTPISRPESTAPSSSNDAITGGITNDTYYTHLQSDNWSGYVDEASVAYTDVVGHWGQNGAAACTGCTGQQEATWVGLGGIGTGSGLAQAGTTDNGNTGNHAWFEYITSCGSISANYSAATVLPDDAMAASVTAAANGGTAGFSVSDGGTVILNASEAFATNGCVDTTRAEYIDERVCKTGTATSCSAFYPLTDYVKTAWGSARVVDNGVTKLWNVPTFFALVNTDDGMNNAPPCTATNDILSYPEDDGPAGGFDDYFCKNS